MAFDIRSMDKKKLGVIGGAVFAGLIAVVLTNSYINDNVAKRAGKGGLSKKEMQALYQKIAQLEETDKALISQQRKLAAGRAQQAQRSRHCRDDSR